MGVLLVAPVVLLCQDVSSVWSQSLQWIVLIIVPLSLQGVYMMGEERENNGKEKRKES